MYVTTFELLYSKNNDFYITNEFKNIFYYSQTKKFSQYDHWHASNYVVLPLVNYLNCTSLGYLMDVCHNLESWKTLIILMAHAIYKTLYFYTNICMIIWYYLHTIHCDLS